MGATGTRHSPRPQRGERFHARPRALRVARAKSYLLFDNRILFRRPCESRDPYAVPSRCGTESETFHNNERRWLWVPAFAGTTQEDSIVKQQIRLRAPRREAPELCIYLPPLRGRGECRVPVAPAASCALVESTQVFTTVAPGSPGIPARNGFNGFLRALPGDRACLPPSSAD